MRVLMITDRSFATREDRLLTRLEVALADDGLRVARAVPEGFAPASSVSLAVSAEYEPRAPLLTTAARTARLLERVTAAPDWAGKPIDIVHAWGERAWSLALDTARRSGASLVVELWSHHLLGKARSFERRAARQVPLTWSAPSDATARALRDAGVRSRCRVAPWGARAADTPAAFSDPIRPVSAVVLATGRNPGSISAALEGLTLASRRHEDLLIFLDAAAVRRSREVWSRLRTIRALDRVSVMPALESRRDPALGADLFIRPEASGEHRSIVLDAMAAGMCVITREDPVVEALQRDQTCLITPEPTALGWEAAALRALDEPQRARTIGSKAQEWIRRHQPVSSHAAALLETYEDILASAEHAGHAA